MPAVQKRVSPKLILSGTGLSEKLVGTDFYGS